MRARMLPLVLLLGLIGALLPAGTAAGSQGAQQTVSLRVMSYNIHSGIGTDAALDLDRTARTIRGSGADIVVLQEVDVRWDARSDYADQVRELARKLRMWASFAPIYDEPGQKPGDERRQFGVAILSKHPILFARNHEITRLSTQDPEAGPEPGPGFAEALVLVAGRLVHVYATHLDFRPDPGVRTAQVADMLRIMRQDGPFARQLLLGDFNATPDSPELAPLWSKLEDAWQVADGAGLSYPADKPTDRIDYVTANGRFTPRAASTVDSLASDHRPVTAELSFS